MLTVIAQGKMKSKNDPTKANAKMMRQKPLAERSERNSLVGSLPPFAITVQ